MTTTKQSLEAAEKQKLTLRERWRATLTHKITTSREGSALMMAIFTVTLLLVISTEIVYQVSVEHLVSAQGVYGVQAYYAAKAGAEISLLRVHIYLKAVSQFGSALPNKSMLDPIWNIPFTWPPIVPPGASGVDKEQIATSIKKSGMKAQYIATIEPESGKIDINDLASTSDTLAKSARAELMQALQTKMDADEAFSQKYRGFDFSKLLDAIRFYANDNKDDVGGFLSAYGTRANDFMPPHRPLQTLQELHLVPGMTDEIFDVLQPRITVYGVKGINVNYATKDVIMSLSPKITDVIAQKVIDARNDPNRGPFKDLNDFVGVLNGFGISGNPFDGDRDPQGNVIPPPLFFDPEMNFRIRSTGISGKVTREITAVVYDFDRVKARLTTFLAPVASGSAGAPAASQTPPAAGQPTTSGTTPAAPAAATPVNVPNERPNVVYWNES